MAGSDGRAAAEKAAFNAGKEYGALARRGTDRRAADSKLALAFWRTIITVTEVGNMTETKSRSAEQRRPPMLLLTGAPLRLATARS
jgi:hypothetical protein